MKARQRKKWPWIECAHLKYYGSPTGFPETNCKQDNKECLQSECKKCFVSKFRKHCEHIGWKTAIRYSRNSKSLIQ